MDNQPKTKRCPKCKETKELDYFHYSSIYKYNRQTYCKICMNLFDKLKREKYRANGPTIIRKNKICITCKIDKPLSEYPKSKDKPDGTMGYCKPCWVKYVKARQSKS